VVKTLIEIAAHCPNQEAQLPNLRSLPPGLATNVLGRVIMTTERRENGAIKTLSSVIFSGYVGYNEHISLTFCLFVF